MSKNKLLHFVRESQQYAAILAELFLFLALIVSSIDASMGGALTSITAIKWGWAIVLALGLDTCFMAAWVRCAVDRRRALLWNIPLAVGMSIIVFLPVSIQMLQQSLDITFSQALSNLGINLVFMTYARSFVAVLLGAVLALTNVEKTAIATGETATKEIASATEIAEVPGEIAESNPEIAIAPASEIASSEIAKLHLVKSRNPGSDEIARFIADNPKMPGKEIAAKFQVSESKISRMRKRA